MSRWHFVFQLLIMRSIIFAIFIYGASIFASEKCEKIAFNTIFINNYKVSRGLLIWFPANIGINLKYDICSDLTGEPLERNCKEVAGKYKWFENNKSNKYVNCKQIVRICKDESFEHYYRNEDNKLEKYLNKWESVRMGEIGHLQKACYLNKGLILTRKCIYDSKNRKAEWEVLDEEKKNITCWKEKQSEQLQNEILSKTERKMHEIQQETLSEFSQDVIKNEKLYKTKPNVTISKATQLLKIAASNRSTADIKASFDILSVILNHYENPLLIPDVLNLISTLMETEANVIKESNCATKILSTIDAYFNNMAKHLVSTNQCKSSNNGIYRKSASLASLFYINPLCSNISGVAIFGSGNSTEVPRIYDQHSNNYYRLIYLNESLEQLLDEKDLKVATYFPLELWNSIINTTAARDDTILEILLFRNDVLFVNQTIMERKPIKGVLEISITDYGGKLPNPLPFIFNNTMPIKNAKPNCGYWNHSTWIRTGINTSHINNIHNNQLLLCYTSHITPFSALLGIGLVDSSLISNLNENALDLISISGCGLSLFGLICIWLTALCFPKWRDQASNKVLLNMCFVLTLIMTFFLLLNLPELRDALIDMKNSVHCMIMGGFLQYIVLVLFSWMLFIAVAQYQRYVKVLGYERPSKYITKYFLMAWGLPLIPTGLVPYYQPNTYMPNEQSINDGTAICYPSGNGLYFGVILPMAIIIVANLFIFIYVCYSLHRSNNKFGNQRNRKVILRQIHLSVLLFFLLGISWIFGMLAHLESSPVFSYIFCFTSTLQGFVLFLYFIVINETTRSHWWNFICCIKSSQTRREYNER